MVAGELGVPVEQVSQDEIDAAILHILSEPSAGTSSAKQSPPKKRPSKQAKAGAKNEDAINKLKGYIFKCGVRRQWKKELQGLSSKQTVDKLERTLKELGMEGRPTLEKCAQIKKRREFEEEMRDIDPGNIISGPRLRRPPADPATRSMVVVSTDEDE